MGKPNRKQHTVPRCYLEAFTDTTGTLWIADKFYNIRASKPERILIQKDYYNVEFPDSNGDPLVIEKSVLGNIEGAYADLYRRVLVKGHSLTTEDRVVLAIFVASMIERSPARRDALEDFVMQLRELDQSMREVMRGKSPEEMKRMSGHIPGGQKGVPLEDVLKASENVGSLHSSMIPNTIQAILPILLDMKWGFLVAPETIPFITSDCPAVSHDPTLPKDAMNQGGLLLKHAEVTIPLSPRLALICGWDITSNDSYAPVPEQMVHSINKRTMLHATSIIGNNEEFIRSYTVLEKKARGL